MCTSSRARISMTELEKSHSLSLILLEEEISADPALASEEHRVAKGFRARRYLKSRRLAWRKRDWPSDSEAQMRRNASNRRVRSDTRLLHELTAFAPRDEGLDDVFVRSIKQAAY